MPISPLILQELALLRGLPRAELERLGEQMGVKELARRELAYRKDDVGESLGFLLDGRMQAVDFTVDGREVGLYFVDPGDYFGELSVIDGKTQPEFMIAVAKARIALLPRQTARTLILSTPELSSQVMTRIALRLRNISAQRTLLAMPNPAQRVCAQLIQLTISSGGKVVISHAPTHQEIAIMINTSRETVTRVFQVLQVKGILKREGDTLAVADLHYLEAVAQGKMEPPKAG